MDKELSILVMGVGGNVGQGILKALKISTIPHRVIGACVTPLAYGLYTTARSYISPYYNDPQFLDWLITICQEEKLDVILTGVEPILSFLSDHASLLEAKTGTFCVTNPPNILLIAQDKLLTCHWLEKNGFPFPQYALASDESSVQQLMTNCHFPLIAKPRFGRGGAGILLLRNNRDLEYAIHQKDYLLQEYIGTTETEYTVGCFNDNQGLNRGLIIMRRELLEGTTYRAIVVDYPELREHALQIVSTLKPKGPCNLQFRVSKENIPICFEINMRFSGTTPLRARFGFNEVDATLSHFVLKKPSVHLPNITKGIALRYWNELYVDAKAFNELNSIKKLTDPGQFNLLIENYGNS